MNISSDVEAPELRIIGKTGGDGTKLFSQKGALTMSPAWSPDGLQIAFSLGDYFRPEGHPAGEIRIMHTDGSWEVKRR